ncbi:hypothetical protein PHSY_003825 [Pseudozyma hubeiensis SY62]|uniref:Uncharacterized protein n=1 Tax=Pseudozyma hubeiensis (strain SY62) TaxID=1305764 RepID=R9PDS7_PSEHS|nr:hypothetical protein PHSY_003825 [Pseudozyma hubeiensis SY62]GAC96245.1 hypothetical protein PHSY_003825 [Pseudozyma hubeiensis SY62]
MSYVNQLLIDVWVQQEEVSGRSAVSHNPFRSVQPNLERRGGTDAFAVITDPRGFGYQNSKRAHFATTAVKHRDPRI